VPYRNFEPNRHCVGGAFVTLLLAGWLIYWIVRDAARDGSAGEFRAGGDPASAGGSGEEAPSGRPPTID